MRERAGNTSWGSSRWGLLGGRRIGDGAPATGGAAQGARGRYPHGPHAPHSSFLNTPSMRRRPRPSRPPPSGKSSGSRPGARWRGSEERAVSPARVRLLLAITGRHTRGDPAGGGRGGGTCVRSEGRGMAELSPGAGTGKGEEGPVPRRKTGDGGPRSRHRGSGVIPLAASVGEGCQTIR